MTASAGLPAAPAQDSGATVLSAVLTSTRPPAPSRRPSTGDPHPGAVGADARRDPLHARLQAERRQGAEQFESEPRRHAQQLPASRRALTRSRRRSSSRPAAAASPWYPWPASRPWAPTPSAGIRRARPRHATSSARWPCWRTRRPRTSRAWCSRRWRPERHDVRSRHPDVRHVGVHRRGHAEIRHRHGRIRRLRLHPGRAQLARQRSPLQGLPAQGQHGRAVADSFLLACEEAANGDYQDYVFVLRNAKVAP